jgi:uncharacterized protein YaiE (UPF0345 family)
MNRPYLCGLLRLSNHIFGGKVDFLTFLAVSYQFFMPSDSKKKIKVLHHSVLNFQTANPKNTNP